MENKLHHRINKMIRDLDNIIEWAEIQGCAAEDIVAAMEYLACLEQDLIEKDL